MKLDVGSGGMPRPGFVSLDRNPDARPDVIADVRELPFRDGAFVDLIAADVLEHVLPWETRSTLDEWRRVLEPRGVLFVRVPNLAQLGRLLHAGVDLANTIRNVYGGHRWGPDGAWDTHHHGWTPETMERDLSAAGFAVTSNDRALNMTAVARRD